jgi:hypothetical protein
MASKQQLSYCDIDGRAQDHKRWAKLTLLGDKGSKLLVSIFNGI